MKTIFQLLLLFITSIFFTGCYGYMNDLEKENYLKQKVQEMNQEKNNKKQIIELLTKSSKIGITYKDNYYYYLTNDRKISHTKLKNIRYLAEKMNITNDDLLEMILKYEVRLDKVDNRIIIEKEPLYNNDYVVTAKIVINNSSVNLYHTVNYRSQDWLFIKSYKIAIDDKRIYKQADFNREVLRGEILEWYRYKSTENNLKLIEDIANSNESSIKFYGKDFYNIKDISNYGKKTLNDIIYIYKSLKK